MTRLFGESINYENEEEGIRFGGNYGVQGDSVLEAQSDAELMYCDGVRLCTPILNESVSVGFKKCCGSLQGLRHFEAF